MGRSCSVRAHPRALGAAERPGGPLNACRRGETSLPRLPVCGGRISNLSMRHLIAFAITLLVALSLTAPVRALEVVPAPENTNAVDVIDAVDLLDGQNGRVQVELA